MREDIEMRREIWTFNMVNEHAIERLERLERQRDRKAGARTISLAVSCAGLLLLMAAITLGG